MQQDVLIIGGGIAGLTAAIYCARAGLSCACIEEAIHGGQIINTPDVENYPGFAHISGAELASNLYEQATGLGAEILYEQIQSLDLSGKQKKLVTTAGERTAKAVIIANGARHRELGCPGEAEFKGKGVSYCATCDGGFYRDKTVFVAGGGNTALQDALYLAGLCKQVHLVHRREEFRGSARTAKAVRETGNIILHLPWQIVGISGEESVQAVTLRNTASGEQQTYTTDGVFVAIGLAPDNERFRQWVDLQDGYIAAGEDCVTRTPGVFAAGDTRVKPVRQLVTAAADGAVAADGCVQYLYTLD